MHMFRQPNVMICKGKEFELISFSHDLSIIRENLSKHAIIHRIQISKEMCIESLPQF